MAPCGSEPSPGKDRLSSFSEILGPLRPTGNGSACRDAPRHCASYHPGHGCQHGRSRERFTHSPRRRTSARMRIRHRSDKAVPPDGTGCEPSSGTDTPRSGRPFCGQGEGSPIPREGRPVTGDLRAGTTDLGLQIQYNSRLAQYSRWSHAKDWESRRVRPRATILSERCNAMLQSRLTDEAPFCYRGAGTLGSRYRCTEAGLTSELNSLFDPKRSTLIFIASA